jgi:hypothetical protein
LKPGENAQPSLDPPINSLSAGRRIVVNQRVAPTVKHPQSLGRISPVEHGLEAMLLVLFNLGQAMGAPSGQDI